MNSFSDILSLPRLPSSNNELFDEEWHYIGCPVDQRHHVIYWSDQNDDLANCFPGTVERIIIPSEHGVFIVISFEDQLVSIIHRKNTDIREFVLSESRKEKMCELFYETARSIFRYLPFINKEDWLKNALNPHQHKVVIC